MAPLMDDVNEVEEEAPPVVARPTAWSWRPPRLMDCARCGATTLTREDRCGRCGFREGT
jgi:hypothetical protein